MLNSLISDIDIRMQKGQIKPKQAKKKNIQTGIVMGQNTNVFSQLSANFLQQKSSTTEEEQQFLKNTQIVEYHDANINRLISLLRKKADATKIKAVLELKEEVSKMTADDMEEFMPTLARLFLETTLNEGSKQITEQFAGMATDAIAKYKKIAVKQISILYAALNLTAPLSKTAQLLFSGTEQELALKAIQLLLKKEVNKKYLVAVRVVWQSEDKQKNLLPQYQRNCQAFARAIKDFIKIFERIPQAQPLQEEFIRFIQEIVDILGSRCVEEYCRVGGKGKAALLELMTAISGIITRRGWKLPWESLVKRVCFNFLDKDPVVQQTLWRACNYSLLQTLLTVQKTQQQDMINTFLPKSEERLLDAIKIGGIGIYKELAHYCEIFPSTTPQPDEIHKNLVNKVNFMRKLLNALLQEEDQNQARSECYYKLASLVVNRARQLKDCQPDQKKNKQINSLVGKLERESVQSLQQKYYNNPPTSKNSFTWLVPNLFCKLVNELKPSFEFKFNPKHTFALCEYIDHSNLGLLDKIYEECKGNMGLMLSYLEIFPRRETACDMIGEAEPQKSARIFLLTSQPADKEWLNADWNIAKCLIAYDPRITQRDLQFEEDDLSFRPTLREFPSKLYDRPEFDMARFHFFQSALTNPDSTPIIKYLIPLVRDILLPRNPELLEKLLNHFALKAKLVSLGKWMVGSHQVLTVRVLANLIIGQLGKQSEKVKEGSVNAFLEYYCEFPRVLSGYKMEAEATELLKLAHQLLIHSSFQKKLRDSCGRTLQKASLSLLSGKTQGQQDKIRKNRLKKCLDFERQMLWHCLPRNQRDDYLGFLWEFIGTEGNWKQALTRAEPWLLCHVLLQAVGIDSAPGIAAQLLQGQQKYKQFIVFLLNTDTLLPLQAQPEARKYYITIKQQFQSLLVKRRIAQLKPTFVVLIDTLMSGGTVQLGEGVKSLITYLLLEREQEAHELIEMFAQACVRHPFEKHVSGQSNIYKALIYAGIIGAVPLRRIENIEEIYHKLLTALNKAEKGRNYLQLLAICCVFWNKNVGVEEFLAEQSKGFKDIFLRGMDSLNCSSTNGSPLEVNFSTYTIFSLVNTVVPHAGQSVIEPHKIQLHQLFQREIIQGSDLHGLTQSMRIRFATRSLPTATPQTLARLVEEVPKMGRAQYHFYNDLLRQIEDDSEEELPHHEHIVNLFIEISEFMLRIGAFLNDKCQPDEQVILQLMQCPFSALKKASFLLLKSLYERNLVERQPPKIYSQLLSYRLEPANELTSLVCGDLSTYLFTWQALLLRKDATQRPPLNEQDEFIKLEDYISGQGYSDLLIKNCFVLLDDKLQYLKNELDYPIAPENLLESDYEVNMLEDQEGHLLVKVFRMAVRTLFLFVGNFPMFLRQFMDYNKKYKNICDRLLRTVISEAIFQQQVGRIEVLEPQWKGDGNFEIYVTPKNKQIYAEYTHDVVRIGLRLTMRGNYPLSHIDIQFGQGLKLDEGSRWALMLQSQLHSRNNSIINGILLWKDNIDKKLEGLQECAICYDIVNSNGQLPKKACKTCKKKFHGNCIMKWFAKSNKSECPLCKSQFL